MASLIRGRKVTVANAWNDIEAPPIEVGRLLAAGLLAGHEPALDRAAAMCSSIEVDEDCDAETAGRAHAVREIGKAALSNRFDVDVPAVKACEICTASETDERFCTRIGEALASGDVSGAADVLVEFDSKALNAKNIGHAQGISQAANEIVGVASVQAARQALIDRVAADD